MLTYENGTIKTSVRRLVEFLFRGGDIRTGSGSFAGTDLMLEGGRLHRKIQKNQADTYRSEVPLTMTWEEEGFNLLLEGRADGIDRICDEEGQEIFLIDEIKCVRKPVDDITEAKEVHLAQAKCYAAMTAILEQAASSVAVQITYCHMETEEIRRIREIIPVRELLSWFDEVIEKYRRWASLYVENRKRRNESIQKLHFPFDYRPGQKSLTAMAHRAMDRGDRVFLQAPTGVGKTISMIYPSLIMMGQGKVERICYLTARTTTAGVAEDTISLMRPQGLICKAVTITARDRICIQDEAVCDPELCPRAKGHYDRINECLYHMLQSEDRLDRDCILSYSREYMVCPYQLAFEAAAFSDLVICDYNYFFDPRGSQTSLFSQGAGSGNVLLIDEAHNLLDRAREMYSAHMSRDDFVRPRRIFRKRSGRVYRSVLKCDRVLAKMSKDGPDPVFYDQIEDIRFPLLRMLEKLSEYLTDNQDFEDKEEILDFYFKMSHFSSMLETLTDGYQIYGEGNDRDFVLRLFCIDPSERLEQYLEECHSGIFFSATLLPILYYRSLLGGSQTEAYCVPSPFPPENRLLAITEDVTSRYSRRGKDLYRRILRYLERTVEAKTGNYMIFFPSYEMMQQTALLLPETTLELVADIQIQEAEMDEKSRADFLLKFQPEPERTRIGFCVLGSVFSEGIDLTGDRLSGALIVGTGLPGICLEREIIREYFSRKEENGYDYAYRYPGMNKVLQAAGRVIRTAEDRGVILLMDDRFLERENQLMFPGDWQTYYPVNENNVGKVLEEFWKD